LRDGAYGASACAVAPEGAVGDGQHPSVENVVMALGKAQMPGAPGLASEWTVMVAPGAVPR